MAAQSKTRATVTEEVKTVTEEVNTVVEEPEVVAEEASTTQEPAALSVTEVHILSAQLALDRMLQNAMASRDQRAWEKYRGAREMAECLGYTITVHSERFHTLSETV